MPNLGIVGDLVEIVRLGSELSIEWRINRHALTSPGGKDDYFRCPFFSFRDACWSFYLYPNWEMEDSNPASGWLRLGLSRWRAGPYSDTIDFSVGIKGSEAGVQMRREGRKECSGYCTDCLWNDFCPRAGLLRQGTRLMPDGTLTITCVLKSPGGVGDDDLPQKREEYFVEQIKALEKRIENHELESETYKKHIRALESEKLSKHIYLMTTDEYTRNCQLKENFSIISKREKEVESLLEEKRELQEKCKEYTRNISATSAELRKDNQQLKKEVQSLVEENKELHEKCKEHTPIISATSAELRKAAFHHDSVNENSSDKEEESRHEKKVKQQNRVKSTKKISLPTRHGDILRSLKSILAEGSRADFTLKSGGREWSVHRAILEGRSRHFDTLIGEAERDDLLLDDTTEDALDDVLDFLYTGEVGRMSRDNVLGINAAARELNLVDLESLCVEWMEEWTWSELFRRAFCS